MDSEVKKREAKAAIVAQKLAQAAKAAAAVTIESSVTPENTETAAQ